MLYSRGCAPRISQDKARSVPGITGKRQNISREQEKRPGAWSKENDFV